MKKVFLVLIILATAVLSLAQTSPAAKPAQDSGFMSWVHDAWKTVQEQGRPAAEQLVKEFPKRFQDVKKQVGDLSKRTREKIIAMDLEQKKNLAIELWRMRKSLDLLTLLRPEVLQSLTGLDTSGLAALETQVQNMIAIVQAQIAPRAKGKGA